MTGSTSLLELLGWFQLMALILGFVAACAFLGERNGRIDENARAIARLTSSVEDLVRAQATMNATIAGGQRTLDGVIRRLDDVVRRLEERDDRRTRASRSRHDDAGFAIDGEQAACGEEVR
jgi:hypothetical protein